MPPIFGISHFTNPVRLSGHTMDRTVKERNQKINTILLFGEKNFDTKFKRPLSLTNWPWLDLWFW